MSLVLVSFLAGILTVGAPCILPLLPIIVGGTAVRTGNSKGRDWIRPLVITGSLVASVIVFTLLLRFSTALLGVPAEFWQIVSGSLVIALGVYFIWPLLWEKVSWVNKLNRGSNRLLATGFGQKNLGGDALMGAALGPIFNSCSPTYLLIVAAILPATFALGLIYLAAYSLGLGLALLALAYGGQRLISKIGWMTNPESPFKKIIGGLFILVGLAVIFGLDRSIQAYILDQGWYNPLSGFEESLRQ
jgi:cytochrome c-type biogenesis protein